MEMQKFMGRPRINAVKKLIGFDEVLLSAINMWRESQTSIPNLTEAIRRLLAIALKIKAPEK